MGRRFTNTYFHSPLACEILVHMKCHFRIVRKTSVINCLLYSGYFSKTVKVKGNSTIRICCLELCTGVLELLICSVSEIIECLHDAEILKGNIHSVV